MPEQTDFQFIESATTTLETSGGRAEDFSRLVYRGLLAGMGFGFVTLLVLAFMGSLALPQVLVGSGTLLLVTVLNVVLMRLMRAHLKSLSGTLEEKLAELETRKEREAQVANRLRELNRSLFEAKQSALAASRTKDLFLANISHELRTPLTVIIGYAEILVDEAEEAERNEDLELLDHILDSARHLLSLINDILDLSKIEAGKIDLVPEWLNVRELVEGIRGDVSKQAEQRNNELVVEVGRRAEMMWADPTRLRQVLLNIVHNAVKFTEDGRVTIAVDRRFQGGKDRTTFKIVDTGIGMNAEQRAKVFQEFIQADAEISKKYGGTGLGLAIVHRTVHLMGGSIYLDSEPGQGTTFVVMLPTEADGQGRPPRPSQVLANDERDVVVVIDDEAAMRDAMVRVVGESGYVAVSAWSGDEGLRLARELNAAAIALNIGLPGKDGWSVLAEIKRDPELCRTPVMLVARDGGGQRAALLGVDHYLTKPVDIVELQVSTATYLDREPEPSVLVVSDDEAARTNLEVALAEQGWHIEVADEAGSAERALDRAPSIVVLDLMMLDLGGFALVRRLVEEHSDVPVIALFSAKLSPEDVFLLHKGVEQAVRYDDGLHSALRTALERQVGPAKAS